MNDAPADTAKPSAVRPASGTFCMRWRSIIPSVMIACYGSFLLVVAPMLVYYSVKDGFTRNDQLLLLSGISVLAAVPISVWHIVQHQQHYSKPALQKHIVRILWMVPIYALNAWFGLMYVDQAFYLDCAREVYEAYVIYNFMVYLLNYLNLNMDLERTLEQSQQQPHVFPLCFMRPWKMGRAFVHNCKHGILQYTVLRVFTTLVAFICDQLDVYGEGSFQPTVAYPYIVAVNNVSQFVAMYCLVLFYKANRSELREMRPLPKFLCIKAVIFFSFIQSVVITALVYFGYVGNVFVTITGDDPSTNPTDEHRRLSSKLQNFLICIEMFLAALAHKYSFPHTPFHINVPADYALNVDRPSWLQSLLAMCDVSDVQTDLSDHFGAMGSSLLQSVCGGGAANRNSVRRRSEYGAIGIDDEDFRAALRSAAAGSVGEFDRLYAAASPRSATAYGAIVGPNINIVRRPADAPQFDAGAPPRRTSQFFGGAGGASTHSTPSHSASGSPGSSLARNPHRSGSGAHIDTFTGLSSTGDERAGTLRKSDSAASDWLSTPADEMCSIEVAGPDKHNLIHFVPDPEA